MSIFGVRIRLGLFEGVVYRWRGIFDMIVGLSSAR